MIDPALLRDDPEVVLASQRKRGAAEEDVWIAQEADATRRAAISAYESSRAEQNLLSKDVANAPADARAKLVEQAKGLADTVKAAQAAMSEAEAAWSVAMAAIANIVAEGVPSGGEENFVTLKTVGKPVSGEQGGRDHLEIGEALGIIDMERGAKIAGSRFYFLVGAGALLENALMNRAISLAHQEGFTLLNPPTLVKPDVMAGTGFLGEHADEIYHLPADELYLTGTSEVALAGYHADEIIDLSGGARRYAALSTCYRREAGSHGRDVRGIIRVHQFQKVEMFSYVEPAEAEAEHERLLAWQEAMLSDLGIHYRVIDVAAGDLGSSAARKFDIEAWIPSQGAFRELTSTSNCTTFQARRLNTRYRPTADGPTNFVATLNGTLATTRWLVALLETHQQSDGSVTIPEVLRPYMGGLERIPAPSRGVNER